MGRLSARLSGSKPWSSAHLPCDPGQVTKLLGASVSSYVVGLITVSTSYSVPRLNVLMLLECLAKKQAASSNCSYYNLLSALYVLGTILSILHI